MLLQELVRYLERKDTEEPGGLIPMEYTVQQLHWRLDLAKDGTSPTLIPLGGQDTRVLWRPSPYLGRSGTAAKPQLLADRAEFALGKQDEKKPDRASGRHSDFRTLIRACAKATGNNDVVAVSRFLDMGQPGLSEEDLGQLKANSRVTFTVEGSWPIDQANVREFWQSIAPHIEVWGASPLDVDRIIASRNAPLEEPIGTCLVCGQIRPITRIHRFPITVAGGFGGQSELTLVSANDRAYESYGLRKARFAPTCRPCTNKYAHALSRLLADDDSHLYAGRTAYVFWTRRPTTFSFARIVSRPTPDQVRSVRLSLQSGQSSAVDHLDSNAFFALGFSADVSRLVVRDWLDSSLDELLPNVRRYFGLQEIVAEDGTEGHPIPLDGFGRTVGLLDGLARRTSTRRQSNAERGDQVLARHARSFIRLAASGDRLGWDVLHRVLDCHRSDVVRRTQKGRQGGRRSGATAERELVRERMAVIKMVLGSRGHIGDVEGGGMVHLDEKNAEPGYVYGRLLAILDEIQREALGKDINTTVIDRYYSGASVRPLSVFPVLIRNATDAHLGKVRRRNLPAAIALQKRLEAVHDLINAREGFLPVLDLPQQGFFALGFYHQRAEERRRPARGSEKRTAVVQATDTSDVA